MCVLNRDAIREARVDKFIQITQKKDLDTRKTWLFDCRTLGILILQKGWFGWKGTWVDETEDGNELVNRGILVDDTSLSRIKYTVKLSGGNSSF